MDEAVVIGAALSLSSSAFVLQVGAEWEQGCAQAGEARGRLHLAPARLQAASGGRQQRRRCPPAVHAASGSLHSQPPAAGFHRLLPTAGAPLPDCTQLLRERGELDSRFGQATLGILLLQDIATVPFLVLLPLIEGNNAGALSRQWRGIRAALASRAAAARIAFAAHSLFLLPC